MSLVPKFPPPFLGAGYPGLHPGTESSGTVFEEPTVGQAPGTNKREEKQDVALFSSQSREGRVRKQIMTNSKQKRHRQTDYKKAAGRRGEFRFCS